MTKQLAAKAPRHRSTTVIGTLAGTLALVFPAGAGAALTLPHPARSPMITVPAPAPSGAPAPSTNGDPAPPSPVALAQDQSGYPGMEPGRELTSVIGGAISGTGTAPYTLEEDFVRVGQDVSDALTSSDPSGQSNVVMDAIAKAFTLLVCAKHGPDDEVPVCAK